MKKTNIFFGLQWTYQKTITSPSHYWKRSQQWIEIFFRRSGARKYENSTGQEREHNPAAWDTIANDEIKKKSSKENHRGVLLEENGKDGKRNVAMLRVRLSSLHLFFLAKEENDSLNSVHSLRSSISSSVLDFAMLCNRTERQETRVFYHLFVTSTHFSLLSSHNSFSNQWDLRKTTNGSLVVERSLTTTDNNCTWEESDLPFSPALET